MSTTSLKDGRAGLAWRRDIHDWSPHHAIWQHDARVRLVKDRLKAGDRFVLEVHDEDDEKSLVVVDVPPSTERLEVEIQAASTAGVSWASWTNRLLRPVTAVVRERSFVERHVPGPSRGLHWMPEILGIAVDGPVVARRVVMHDPGAAAIVLAGWRASEEIVRVASVAHERLAQAVDAANAAVSPGYLKLRNRESSLGAAGPDVLACAKRTADDARSICRGISRVVGTMSSTSRLHPHALRLVGAIHAAVQDGDLGPVVDALVEIEANPLATRQATGLADQLLPWLDRSDSVWADRAMARSARALELLHLGPLLATREELVGSVLVPLLRDSSRMLPMKDEVGIVSRGMPRTRQEALLSALAAFGCGR